MPKHTVASPNSNSAPPCLHLLKWHAQKEGTVVVVSIADTACAKSRPLGPVVCVVSCFVCCDVGMWWYSGVMFVIYMICVMCVCMWYGGVCVCMCVVCGGEAVVLCCGITDRSKRTTQAQRVRCVVLRLSCMVA